MHAIPHDVAEPAKPAAPLIAIRVATKHIDIQIIEQLQLRPDVLDFSRERAVPLVVREPLPVIRSVDDPRWPAPLQHGLDRLFAFIRVHGTNAPFALMLLTCP